jgi:hypothetical protein
MHLVCLQNSFLEGSEDLLKLHPGRKTLFVSFDYSEFLLCRRIRGNVFSFISIQLWQKAVDIKRAPIPRIY